VAGFLLECVAGFVGIRNKLIIRLGDKDFEVLIDLILSRSGWDRLAKVGGVTEGIDIEVQNRAADEIAFVQVKSSANQKTLDDYVSRFSDRRDHYDRMIFAVHTPQGDIVSPDDQPVQLWSGKQSSYMMLATKRPVIHRAKDIWKARKRLKNRRF
jgi:hypothetical protein